MRQFPNLIGSTNWPRLRFDVCPSPKICSFYFMRNKIILVFYYYYSIRDAAEMWLIWYICKFTEWNKSTLNILYLVLYSARSRNVTWHRIFFLVYRVKKSQIWSLPVLYSIRHAVEMWETSHIFWAYRVKNGNLGYSLSRTLFGTRQKCDYIVDFSGLRVKIIKFE